MKLKFLLSILLFTSTLIYAQPTIQFQKTYGGSFNDNDIRAEIVTSDGGYMLAGILSFADAILIKLDATGNLVWKKTYGGTGDDHFYSVQQTADGGYIVAGGTASSDGDVSGQHGTAGDNSTDIWVVKVDANGVIVWQKCYGGTGSEAYDNASIVKTSDGGFVISSSSNSTDGDITGNHAGSTDCVVIKTDVNGSILWEKTLGGSGSDVASIIKQTTDGGYIIGATSDSKDGDVTGNHGLDDLWIIKLNGVGAITWQKSFGGTLTERYPSLQQTTDGGYIVAGLSASNDGDVSGHHGSTGGNNNDFWIIKLDASGVLTWQKSLGGTGEDDPAAIIQTSDGGYIATGQNYSNDGDVSGHTGPTYEPDAWVVKLNSTGGVMWQHSMDGLGVTPAYGRDIKETTGGFTMAGVTNSRGYYAAGDYYLVKFDNTGNITWQVKNGASEGNDYAYSGQQTSDGGYIIAGDASSTNGDVTGTHGGYDWWIVKTNSSGAIQWQKALGGSADDYCYSIQQTSDGGYIAAGETKSTDGDVTVNHGIADCWVVKLDASGNLVWQKSFGGTLVDYANYIQQTSDAGYIMAGVTGSNNGDVSGNHGLFDYWIVKLDASGNIVWQKTFGGTDYDYAYSVKQTTDGGYIVAGDEASADGDVTGNHGSYDNWILKLNASGTLMWQKTFGGAGEDDLNDIQQTADGGYITAGSTVSTDGDVTNNKGNYDAWIIKMDASGTLQWQKTFGGSDYDYMKSIKQTSDGGYVVGGYEGSIDGDVTGNHGSYDYWALKLDASGTLQWQKTMGGSGQDYAYTMQTTSDGGIVFFGDSPSNNGDVTNNHQPTGFKGKYDYWMVKLSPIALPVTLLNFDGILQNNAAILNWSTATEINDKGFEVQKSADGQSFSNIGFVAGAGSSSLRHNYTFSDAKLVGGSNYYRLQQIDLDGKISYSSIIRIDFTKFDWSLLNNASNQSLVQFQLDKATSVFIQVISINGTIIRTINKGKIGAGTYSIPLDLSNEASGIYMIKLTANDKSYIKRIVK